MLAIDCHRFSLWSFYGGCQAYAVVVRYPIMTKTRQGPRWIKGLIICLLICVVVPVSMVLLNRDLSPTFSYDFTSWCYHLGDDSDWAAHEYDDGDWPQAEWQSYIGDQTQDYSGTLWVRLHLRMVVNDRWEKGRDQRFYLGMLAEHEVYWDGEPLECLDRERATQSLYGEMLHSGTYCVPYEKLGSGDHVIAIRVEDHQRLDPRLFQYTFFDPLPDYSFWAIYYRNEDQFGYSAIEFDKQDWAFVRPLGPTHRLPDDRSGVFWMRFQCLIPEGSGLLSGGRNQLAMTSLGALEVYWDGQCIGRTGIPAEERKDEVPGDYLNIFSVPDSSLGPGKHEVAIRASQHFTTEHNLINYIDLLNQGQIVNLSFWLNSKTMIPLGFTLMTSLFFGFYFFIGERRLAHLALSLYCLAISLVLMIQLYPRMCHLSYVWVNPLQISLYGLVVAGGALLLTFHLYLFSIPKKGYWLIFPVVYLCIVAYPMGFHALDRYLYRFGNPTNLAILPVMFLCATMCILAIRRGVHGSWFALYGICLLLATMLGMKISETTIWEGSVIYFAFGGHMFCLILSTISEGQEWRRNYQRSLVAQIELELNKTRLESELNKKNIQPHFIMNTLTSLMEWVEKDPQRSVEFIETLAREFRLASELSSETTIPLSREIEVCRSFLDLMSFQQKLEFRLSLDIEPESLVETFRIPPYILQTLTENGITHNVYCNLTGPMVFSFSARQNGNVTNLIFETPYSPDAGEPSHPDIPGATIRDGNGLTYVKARLRESYGDRWSLTQGVQQDRWCTHIRLEGDRAR